MNSDIEVGTQLIGKWGAYQSYSYGEVTSIHENGMIEVNFDDLDGYSLFWPREIKSGEIDKLGVYLDNDCLYK